jgi:hypothetical protein
MASTLNNISLRLLCITDELTTLTQETTQTLETLCTLYPDPNYWPSNIRLTLRALTNLQTRLVADSAAIASILTTLSITTNTNPTTRKLFSQVEPEPSTLSIACRMLAELVARFADGRNLGSLWGSLDRRRTRRAEKKFVYDVGREYEQVMEHRARWTKVLDAFNGRVAAEE